MRGLATHWLHPYGLARLGEKLNAYPQFTTQIDGQNVHFLHVRSPEPNVFPLVLTYGRSGSVVEYLDVTAPLTDPRARGLDPALAFHRVIPSVPGFGFSGPAKERGWTLQRVARAWAELVRRLGYDRYGAVSNDAGSMIRPKLAGRTRRTWSGCM